MNPETAEKIEQDMSFVRAAVTVRDQRQYGPVATVVLWATLIGIGFTLLDFYPRVAMWFMFIAPPLGYFASAWLGGRAERRIGVMANRTHTVHWGFVFVLTAAMLSIASRHQVSGQMMGQLMTLVSGAACFFYGLHLDRRYLWPGIVLVLGSAASGYIEPYPWTMVGLVTAASLIASAVRMKPAHVEPSATN